MEDSGVDNFTPYNSNIHNLRSHMFCECKSIIVATAKGVYKHTNKLTIVYFVSYHLHFLNHNDKKHITTKNFIHTFLFKIKQANKTKCCRY